MMNQTDLLQFESLAHANRVVIFTNNRDAFNWPTITISFSGWGGKLLLTAGYTAVYLLVVYLVTEVVINTLFFFGSFATLALLFLVYSSLKFHVIETFVAKWLEPKPLPKNYVVVPKI